MSLGPVIHYFFQSSHSAPAAHFEATIQRQGPIARDGISVATSSLASIIKIPPTEPPTSTPQSFNELSCSAEDIQKITRLISVMGENGKVVLLFKYQKELRQIGRDIEHVHPLKMLSTILSNPSLKKCMQQIYTDYFKWSNFMDGLGNGLTSQHKQNKVVPFLNDFAQICGVTPDSLKKYVDQQDWENMVIYLINT